MPKLLICERNQCTSSHAYSSLLEQRESARSRQKLIRGRMRLSFRWTDDVINREFTPCSDGASEQCANYKIAEMNYLLGTKANRVLGFVHLIQVPWVDADMKTFSFYLKSYGTCHEAMRMQLNLTRHTGWTVAALLDLSGAKVFQMLRAMKKQLISFGTKSSNTCLRRSC